MLLFGGESEKRWGKKLFLQVKLSEEPVTAPEIFSKRVVPRGLGYFFDPIIAAAHALLGATKSMYPGLQTASKFRNKDYTLDP